MDEDKKKPIDILAFDWDGTLFDSTAAIANSIQAAVRDVGATPPSHELALWVIGLGWQGAITKAAPDLPKSLYAECRARFHYHYCQFQGQLALFPGTLEMLQSLKRRGFILTIATGKSRQGLNQLLFQNSTLKDLFDSSRTSDETAGKPDPMMLNELLEEYQLAPDRMLMIGDTSHDLQMAKNAGVASLGVSYGAHLGDNLRAFEPLSILASIEQLQHYLVHHIRAPNDADMLV